MPKIISLFIFMSVALCCRAQMPLGEDHYADSVSELLQRTRTDSSRAKLHLVLVHYWAAHDTAKARQHLEQGRALGQKYPFINALSYINEGLLYINSDMDHSEQAYMKADHILEQIHTQQATMVRSRVWQNYAVIQQRKDNDEAYIEAILHKAIPLALQAGDTMTAAAQYVGVGVAFMNTEQFDKAETYFDRAIHMMKSGPADPAVLVSAYNRAGENYINLKKYTEAKKVLDTVKRILAPYPGAEQYSGYYLVEGLYYHHLQDYAHAAASFDKGIAAAGGINKAYRIQELQMNKATSLVAGKMYGQAKGLLTALSQDEETMSLDENRRGVYEGLAATYAGLGDKATAYEWQKRYSDLNDSIGKSRLKHDINALEIKYKNVEARREVTALKVEKEKIALSARNSRLVALSLGSLLLLLLGVATAVLLLYRSRRKLLLQQLKETARQKELEVAGAMIRGEEQERSRMARELHDGLGGMLAGVKIKLSGQRDSAADLEPVILQLDESVSELRRIARNMMPESLLKFGLETALEDLCSLLRSNNTAIEFQAYGIEKNIPVSVQAHIYRIIQELLSNALRHAQASRILLQCSQNGNIFLITAEDNGKGFDVAAASKQPGIGLSNIRTRVEYLKGSLDIVSAPGEGTTINVELDIEG